MRLRRNDISTWAKTADLLYMETNFQMAKDLLQLEQKYFKRPYNIKRIIGRLNRLYHKALVYSSKEALEGIKPTKRQDIEDILYSIATLRTNLRLKKLSLKQLYSFLRYEYENKNRNSIKQVLATQIIKRGDYGVRI